MTAFPLPEWSEYEKKYQKCHVNFTLWLSNVYDGEIIYNIFTTPRRPDHQKAREKDELSACHGDFNEALCDKSSRRL